MLVRAEKYAQTEDTFMQEETLATFMLGGIQKVQDDQKHSPRQEERGRLCSNLHKGKSKPLKSTDPGALAKKATGLHHSKSSTPILH